MNGCLMLGVLGLVAWIAWEIFIELLDEAGWFWGIIIAVIIIGVLLSKKR